MNVSVDEFVESIGEQVNDFIAPDNMDTLEALDAVQAVIEELEVVVLGLKEDLKFREDVEDDEDDFDFGGEG